MPDDPGDMYDLYEFVRWFDGWLDDNVSEHYKEQPLAQDWARASKVIEELGEAITNLIGYTAQNPRKGVTCSQRDFLDELADTMLTCLLCMQHFTKNIDYTNLVVIERLQYRRDKAHIAAGVDQT